MNVQVIAGPDGTILWTFSALPGKTHDLTAARVWGVQRELEKAGILTLADKGYQGAEATVVITPCRGDNKPESQRQANRSRAKLCEPGTHERAAQELAHPTEVALLPQQSRPARQSHRRPAEPPHRSDHPTMKWVQCDRRPEATQACSYPGDSNESNLITQLWC